MSLLSVELPHGTFAAPSLAAILFIVTLNTLKIQVKEYDVIKQNIDSILRQGKEQERGKETERG